MASITLQNNILLPIYIVDNASIDNTKTIVEKWQNSINNLIYNYEPNIGLSHARNSLITKCTSEYIHYIDDDTVLLDGFFEKLISFLLKYKPEAYTGKIIPSFADERPKWYQDIFLTGSNTSLKTGLLDNGFMMGGNMGIKTERLKILGGFPTNFGKGSLIMFGEETYLEYIIRRSEIKLHYCEDIPILHFGNDNTVFKILKSYFYQCCSNIKLKDALKVNQNHIRSILSNVKEFVKYIFVGIFLIIMKKNYYYQNWLIHLLKPLIIIYTNSLHIFITNIITETNKQG